MKKLPKLYARTSNGAIQQWEIIVEGSKFYTMEGLKDHKITTSMPTECQGKNLGRSNETSPEDQAAKEAQAKWKKKLDSGYFESLNDIDQEKFTEPMLAKSFEDDWDKKLPVWSQPKLDGVRCICRKDGMWTRGGKQVISAPHIRKALEAFFIQHPDVILDGEMYCDKFSNDFNKIISLVKKTKPTTADLDESEKYIEYHVYDCILKDSSTFEARSKWLKDSLNALGLLHKTCIKFVKTDKCKSIEELDKLYGDYLEAGYEGQMVRLDKPYENKRSKFLLKRKEFKDSEYKILDITEGVGNRTGTAGFMTLELPNGNTFKSNIKGSFKFLKECLDNKDFLLGKLATVKYFNLTPDGVPRFPYVITVRDYE